MNKLSLTVFQWKLYFISFWKQMNRTRKNEYSKKLPDIRPSIAPHLEGSIRFVAKHYGCQEHIKLLKDFLSLWIVQLICTAKIVQGPHIGTKSESCVISSLQRFSQHLPWVYWSLLGCIKNKSKRHLSSEGRINTHVLILLS